MKEETLKVLAMIWIILVVLFFSTLSFYIGFSEVIDQKPYCIIEDCIKRCYPCTELYYCPEITNMREYIMECDKK